jgi:hypothetical protein
MVLNTCVVIGYHKATVHNRTRINIRKRQRCAAASCHDVKNVAVLEGE